MKKKIIIIVVLIAMLFNVGCNGTKTENINDLNNEINRLNEIVDLLSKINELEKEIAELIDNKADQKKIESLEQEIWKLRSDIQRLDIRTSPFPQWNNLRVGFNIKDLNHFMEDDYEKFVNEHHNHILTIAGNCIKSEVDIDGLETVTFESCGSQIKIKTSYQNGETFSILGKWMQIDFLFTLENGFTLGTFDYCYWAFPEYYFKFINIQKPEDAHYGTIKEAIEREEKQVSLEISNERFGEYFIEEHNLKYYFSLIVYNFDTKKIIITLENNVLTQEMFLKLTDIFFPMYADSALIIRS